MSTHDTMLAALKAAEPVLADIDRHLRTKHPGMQTLEALATVRAAIAAPTAEANKPQQAIEYTPGEWFDATTVDLMEAFYRSRLPAIREAAKEHGYAIGVHGSLRRDLDLIAAPWRDGASDADTLVEAIQRAACGFTQSKYQWENKPAGRVAISVPICWTHRHGVLSDGHIDLSVLAAAAPTTPPAEQRPQNCGTGFCSCIECPYHAQPCAKSCECSK